MSNEVVRPTLTLRQAQAIRLALKCYLDWEDAEANDVRAMTNALRRLDAAEMTTRRRRRTRDVWA